MTGFVLKLIAALSMLIDHAGLLLFPDQLWMRLVGRLAMPIFAYCIAEGFLYTRSRWKYLLRLSVLGCACQIVYYVAAGDTLLGILITFSLSVLLMWLADVTKRAFAADSRWKYPLLLACTAAVAAVYLLCRRVEIDYGFWGIMLPVWISLFEDRQKRLAAASLGLLMLCADGGLSWQWYSAFAIPILAVYNGKPGRVRMKYFFYIFYPAHLGILQLIAWIVK